jgi:uncharacterized damage-inducible protein DinB
MATSMLDDAFAHHVWATKRVLDECAKLSPEQLETTVPGTYGSILDTVRHIVGSDAWYRFRLSRETTARIDEDHMSVAELRAAFDDAGEEWSKLLADNTDPDALVEGRNDDGGVVYSPTSIRIAQVLHHGTDHRSQICTALTTLGIEPPQIDVWDFADAHGRMVEGSLPS